MKNIIKNPIFYLADNTISTESASSAKTASPNTWSAFYQNAVATFKVWQHRSNTRRELSGLSERTLQDIGLTRHQVQNECKKFFWQA